MSTLFRNIYITLLLIIVFVFAAQAAPQPRTISYQGYLKDGGGVPVNGSVTMSLRLYDSAEEGTPLWIEKRDVPVTNGIYHINLGEVTPFNLPFDQQYWLGIIVNDDPEMQPRQQLSFSPYAFRSTVADTIPDRSVTAAKIAEPIPAANLDLSTVVKKAGDTMSGALNLPPDGLAVGTNQLVTSGGKVGIGTATPSEQLELTGNLRLPTTGVIMSGANTLLHTYGSNNYFSGVGAGNFTTSGWGNTASGNAALSRNTTGYQNTASGVNALYNNTTGIRNTAIGSYALYNNTTGGGNTALGEFAGYPAFLEIADTTGSRNTFIGYFAGPDTSTRLTNATAIGAEAVVNASNKVRIGDLFVEVIEGQVAWSNPSDSRLKRDIADVSHGLDFIKQLRPVEFRMNTGNGRKDFGFIAQDVEVLLGTEYNVLGIGGDEERTLTLRYTDFIAPMVKAMQEQQAVIERQQASIERQNITIGELTTELAELKRLVMKNIR